MKKQHLSLILLLTLLTTLCLLVACTSADEPADTTADTQGVLETTLDTVVDTVVDTAVDTALDAPVDTTIDTPLDTVADTTPETQAPETQAPKAPFDPQAAADAGMGKDEGSYTLSYENDGVTAKWEILSTYPEEYADKNFVLTGYARTTEDGASIISLDTENTDTFVYVYYPAGVDAPVDGDLVKVSATYELTIDMGGASDFTCYTMMASSVEVLERGKAPNGGVYMYVTASSLNVRSTPYSKDDAGNALNNIVGVVNQGEMVEVIETGFGSNGNWVKIIFEKGEGGIAYVSGSYLSETKP